MNERYLFRAKRIDSGEWEIGSLICLPNWEYEIANKCTNPPDSDTMWGKCVITHKVDPSTIGQCTGLKDKNGNLLWENDIGSDECGNMAEIIWNDAELQYLVDYEFEPMALGEWCSVVGNIFDNPELMHE